MDWFKASDEERQKEAERRIAEVRRDGSRRLDLGDLGLSRLPESLAEVVELEELALGSLGFGKDGQPEWFYRPEPTFDSLAPLAQLKGLRLLLLGPCATESLEPVFCLSQLQHLTIAESARFSGDLASLAGFSQLQSLTIVNCAGFSGELASLAALSQLQSLAIGYCAGFSGELASLAALSQLQSLTIMNCEGFSGELAGLAGLRQLRSLTIQDCPGFSGELASLAALSQLQSLTIMNCEGFSGELASLAALSQLQSLAIKSCDGFSGDLSSLAALSRLQSLTIQVCGGFSGELASLAGLSQLQVLTIEYCYDFSGELTSLAGLSQLQCLKINFCGSFSGELACLTTLCQLQSLTIQYSYFSGELASLAGLSQLQNLTIESCYGFSGDLSSLAGLSQLQNLTIESCYGFSGDLSSLAGLSQLQNLTIESCHGFSGALSSLAGLSHLQNLTIQSCDGFSGELSSLTALSQLQSLTIQYCAGFSGDLSSLAGLSHLQNLTIQSCDGFSGDLSSLAGLSQLQNLTIRSCDGFSGDLSSLAGLSQLQSLKIEYCVGFSGDLSSLATLSQLQNLALEFCVRFSGELTSLAGLSQLQRLRIEYCVRFSGELASLAGLSQLQSLKIDSCVGFSGDLSSLAGLSQLQSLTIQSCDGFSGDLSSLAGLSQLQSLTIWKCAGFSGDLSSFAGLSQLRDLMIWDCAGFSGDLSSLAGLSQLQDLTIESCDGFSGDLLSLAGLSQLQNLTIRSCAGFSGELSSLAGLSQLQSLNIWECSGLAGGVLQIPTLRRLEIFGCPHWVITPATLGWHINKKPELERLVCQHVAGIPTEILSRSATDDCLARMQNYLKELEAGIAREKEVKLILLGNGRVGKTQLCRRMRGTTYQPNSVSTHGVQLCRQKLEIPGANGPSTFYANWWDFGGQDTYHSTHSLFLRSRAVFLVLWAPDFENTDEFEENAIPMRNQPLVYWLDYLRSMAGRASPVIVVQSRCESFAARREPPVRAEGFDCVQYAHFGAANDHGRDGLEAALREALRYLTEKTGKLEIGVGRAELRRRLFELRDAGQRILALADYESLCAEIDSFVSPEHALDYYHQTGVVFYQPGLFGGQIVLDQSWALEAVYSVFQRAKALPALRDRGCFTRKDLEVLCWEGKSQEEQQLFLGLMESCQICFVQTRDPTEENEHVYLAPDLLPPYEKVAPQLFAWLDSAIEVTNLHVEYRFLHQAVLRSLISGVGSNVGPNAVYWKYGLWFRTANGSQLLIRQEAPTAFAGPGAGTIVLSAKGPDALSLLNRAHRLLAQQAVHEKPTETLELAGVRVPRSALVACVENKVRTRDGRLVEARPFEAFFAGDLEAMKTESRIDAAPLPKPEVFLSYAWGDDESPEGRQRAEAADRLCDELRQDFTVHRDRDAIQAGESISDYIDKLTHGRYLVALVSDKYLRSPYCMFEIYKLYQACQGEKKQLLERVVPVVLPEVKIARLPDRVPYLEHWSEEAERYEALLRNPRLRLGESSMKEHNLVRDFANHVDEILVFIADVIMPRKVDDFSAVREALRRKMGLV